MLESQASREFRRTELPIVLRFVAGFGFFFTAITVVLTTRAILGMGPYLMGGMPVEREEWLKIAAPLMSITSIEMLIASLAILKRRAWSRHVVMLVWATVGGYALVVGFVWQVALSLVLRAIVQALVLGTISWWYFYKRPVTVAYFKSLQDNHRVGG